MKVGFIGLGTMGGPMAANIARGGHELTVFDVNENAVLDAVAAGACAAADAKACAADADMVITMLPNPADVEAVALGAKGAAGFIQVLQPNAIYVDMSTGDPEVVRQLGTHVASEGAHMLDCPVGRTRENAVAGTLALMCGGDDDIIDRAEPILMCMGELMFRCGALGAGMVTKLTNNLLATAVLAASSEALVLGAKAGLSLHHMISVFDSTAARNHHINVSMQNKVFRSDYTPSFPVRLGEKDIRLALCMAAALDVDAPIGRATHAAINAAIDAGFDNEDITSILRPVEDAAGLTLRLEDKT